MKMLEGRVPRGRDGADITPSVMSADYIADMPDIGMSAPATK